MTEHKTEDGQCQGRAEAFSSEASKAERLLAVASSEQPSLYPCDTPESLKWQRGNSSVSLVLQRGTTPFALGLLASVSIPLVGMLRGVPMQNHHLVFSGMLLGGGIAAQVVELSIGRRRKK
jgi:hypothetical protein